MEIVVHGWRGAERARTRDDAMDRWGDAEVMVIYGDGEW